MKSKKLLLIIVILLLVVFSFINRNNQDKGGSAETTQIEEVVVEKVEKEEVIGPLSIEMISPEEEEFIPRQARFWKGQISNAPKSKFITCDWKFYISMYQDDERLYQERTSRSAGDTCGFTSTFIEEEGKLRVELEVNVKEKYDSEEIIDSAKTEKVFMVSN